jgi:hypothetical protein
MADIRIVELVGIPGSGKTYVKRRLAETPSTAGRLADFRQMAAELRLARMLGLRPGGGPLAWLPARWRRRAAESVSRRLGIVDERCLAEYAEANPEVYELILGNVVSATKAPGERALLLSWFHRLMGDLRLVDESAGAPQVLLLEEGFAQRGISLFAFSPETTQNALSDYAGAVPAPEVLVVVRASLETAFRRLVQRGWPHRAGALDTAGRQRFLAHCSDLVEATVAAFRRRGTPMLEIDNDEGAVAVEESRVVQELEDLLRSTVKPERDS